MTSNNLAGKRVVIIGGTAGIGLAAAILAAEQGAKVWAAGRSAGHIERAKQIAKGRFEVRLKDAVAWGLSLAILLVTVAMGWTVYADLYQVILDGFDRKLMQETAERVGPELSAVVGAPSGAGASR